MVVVECKKNVVLSVWLSVTVPDALLLIVFLLRVVTSIRQSSYFLFQEREKENEKC